MLLQSVEVYVGQMSCYNYGELYIVLTHFLNDDRPKISVKKAHSHLNLTLAAFNLLKTSLP